MSIGGPHEVLPSHESKVRESAPDAAFAIALPLPLPIGPGLGYPGTRNGVI